MKKTLHIKVRAIPEDKESLFVGPERVDSDEFRVKTSELEDVIHSIESNPSDAEELSHLVARRIESVRFDTPRPDEGATSWFIIKRHTPDRIWPSFTYFGAHCFNTIEWHVALKRKRLQSLIEQGDLVVEFR